MKWRPTSAFTLIEMMVVLAISLMLMVLIVPIFNVTTKTVGKIERRLTVFEAARNILDLIEGEMKVGVINEKGQHWSLKHVSWLDKDSFTPVGPSPAIDPGVTDVSNLAYYYDRRFSDAVDYVRLDGTGMESGWTAGPPQFPGGKCFPLAYAPQFCTTGYFPDVWKASMRSTLLYQTVLEGFSRDFDSDNSFQRWNRNEQLNDVSQSELSFIYYPNYCQFSTSTSLRRHYDQVPDFFGPGREIRQPTWYAGYTGVAIQRRLGGIKLMDLNVSYWDDSPAVTGGKQFKDLPDNTEVQFWPPPKAIRVTITVCDREKRDRVTMARVIQIPAGTGSGVVANTTVAPSAMDTMYYTDGPQNANYASGKVFAPALDQNGRLYFVTTDSSQKPLIPCVPASGKVYNRTKYMPALPPSFNGDASYPGTSDGTTIPSSNDWSTASETSTILYDGVKPYKWP